MVVKMTQLILQVPLMQKQRIPRNVNKIQYQKMVSQARKTKGYIQKKSRGMISTWLKRYYIIFNSKLQYYLDEALDIKKGDINIQLIEQIRIIGQTEFSFEYGDKIYQMKCESENMRDLWVNSLNLIKETIIREQQLSQLNSPRSPKKMKIKDKKIRKKSFNLLDSNQDLKEVLSLVKLTPVLKEVPILSIENRFVFLKTIKGFYWLISHKTIQYHEDDMDMLKFQLIKPYDLNTLYFIDRDMKVKDICKCRKIKDINIQNNKIIIDLGQGKRMTKQFEVGEQGYAKRFEKRLRKAIENDVEEFNSSKGKTPKYIQNLIQTYTESAQSFQQLIAKQFSKLIVNAVKDAQSLFYSLKAIINYLKSFYETCRIKSIPKKFITDYINIFHRMVYPLLQQGWDNTYNTFSKQNIGQFSDIINEYRNLIKNQVDDRRIVEGALTLFKIYLQKTYEEIQLIINQSLVKSQVTQRQGNLTNTANTTVLESVLECIQGFKQRVQNQQNFTEQALTIKKIFNHFCSKIIHHSEKWTELNMLIGTCNDVWAVKQYTSETLKKQICSSHHFEGLFTKICSSEIRENLIETELTIIKKIFIITFSEIDKKLLSKNLGQIDIGKVALAIQEKIKLIKKTKTGVLTNIYTTAFDQLCYFYYNCIIRFTNRQNYTAEQIDCKISNDLLMISKSYSTLLPYQLIHQRISDLQILQQFILCEASQTTTRFLEVKNVFMGVLDEISIQSLVNLKNGNNDFKKKVFEECIEIMKKNANEKNQQRQPKRQSFVQNWSYRRSRKSTLKYERSYSDFNDLEMANIKQDHKEGYLMKQKILQTRPINYLRVYYKLKNGKLFEFENKNSQKHLSFLSLENIKKCYFHPDQLYVIVLQLNKQKYNLKATNKQEATAWLEKIYEQIGNLSNFEQNNSELFKNYFDEKTTVDYRISPNQAKVRKNSGGVSCCNFFN